MHFADMVTNQEKHNNKLSLSGTILAAGAILWRKEPFASDVAIIHRTRYREEWCLPKGKVKEGETLEQAALREVKEETGCLAKIVRFSSLMEYKINGAKKQVFYWHMMVIDEAGWENRDPEVDQIIWLPPEEAIKLLSHQDQRKMIKDLFAPKNKTAKHKWFRFKEDARYHRLAGSLLAYRTELEQRKCASNGNKQIQECWATSAIKLISDAEKALNSGDIDEAWKCFHAAQRMELFSLNYDQLVVKATVIRNEADKIGSWRKRAILELLNPASITSAALLPPAITQPDAIIEKVLQAALLRDESYDNQAHKDSLWKEHIRFLAYAALIVGFTMILCKLLNVVLKPVINQNTLLLIHSPLFGMLGAIFSAALKLQVGTHSSRIPELLNTRILTTLRIFIGGISAIALYLFINSQFVSNLFTLDPLKSPSYLYTFYFIMFVAGFSERLVLKAINTVNKDSDQAESK
jgi:8-oxo-dGTP pyrophosphatase MutT (NUDIX family)